jgi:hypothetical protein
MYVSLADSRAKGFKKWADVHQPEKLGGARAGAGEGGVIAAPDLAQGLMTPAVSLNHSIQFRSDTKSRALR